MRNKVSLVLAFVCLLGAVSAARADDSTTFGPSTDRSPSMLAYGFKGMGTGTLIGVSVGYLVGRRGGYQKTDWRSYGLGAGIGALAGMGVGLGLGAADLAANRPGVGGIVLRDTFYGVTLGGVAGLLGGGIAALVQHNAERVPLGGAVGAVAGAGVGLIVGFIEGPRIVNDAAHRRQARRVAPTVLTMRDGGNNMVVMPAAVGRF